MSRFRVLAIIPALALLVACSAGAPDVASVTPTEAESTPIPAATEEATPITVEVDVEPTDVMGWNLRVAVDELEGQGFDVVTHDSREDRAILNRANWVVTSQEKQGSTVVLGAEKSSDSTPAVAPVEATEATNEAPAAAPAPDLTIGQKNAVDSARNYLSFMPFSRSGLIDQLEYEGYSTEDATFAVDHIAPDWYEQAAKSAQNYLDLMSFSRQGLIDQLVFEGFSQDEAEHGVTAVGY